MDNAAKMRDYRKGNKEWLRKHRIYTAGQRRRYKIQVLTHYGKGGRLCCRWRNCQIDDIDMLTIDHVNDDGARHREEISNGRYRNGGGTGIYPWLIRNNFPPGFQTLCQNHQWKKEIQRRKALRLLHG